MSRDEERYDNYPAPATYTKADGKVRLLGLAILAKAAEDAIHHPFIDLRLGAEAWLTNESEDLELVCTLARVRMETVVKLWRGRLRIGEGVEARYPRGYVYMLFGVGTK